MKEAKDSPRPWSQDWLPLVAACVTALRRARGSPRRAAAILDPEGAIHAGCSVSVRDLPASALCAEHVAVAALCASGGRQGIQLAVIGPAPVGAGPPCGRCLQVLLEFGMEWEIRWGTASRERGRSTLRKLMPAPFVDYRDLRG